MYSWEHAQVMCQLSDEPLFRSYGLSIGKEMNRLLRGVTPDMLFSSIRKLHKIDQISRLLLLFLEDPVTRNSFSPEALLRMVEEEYQASFYDQFKCSSEHVKESLLYQIEGKERIEPKTFILEKQIEKELAAHFSLSKEEVTQKYSEFVSYYQKLQQKAAEVQATVCQGNFFRVYKELRKLDVTCLYLMDSMFLLGQGDMKRYWELFNLDLPRYEKDLIESPLAFQTPFLY